MRSGGCQCGAVRFQVDADRLIAYACHCLDCQKQTTSAFGLSVPARAEAFTIEGPVGRWARSADSGATTDCFFCGICGSRVYHQSSRSSAWVTVRGGALDETADLGPVAHLWVKRKQAWLQLPDDAVCFDTQPDDLAGWREALVAAATD